MADVKNSKHLDQVQLEREPGQIPATSPQAGRNIVKNPLKVSSELCQG